MRAWCGPRFQGHPRTVTRTCGNLCRRGVGVSNTPTPNHKETSPNGRNATPRPKPQPALCGISTGLRRRYVNMFEGPVTGNIPEVLDNGEVTDGTHVTAGQLALALTQYAQVTDLAVSWRPCPAGTGSRRSSVSPASACRCAQCSRRRHGVALKPPTAKLAKATELWLLERTKKFPSVVSVGSSSTSPRVASVTSSAPLSRNSCFSSSAEAAVSSGQVGRRGAQRPAAGQPEHAGEDEVRPGGDGRLHPGGRRGTSAEQERRDGGPRHQARCVGADGGRTKRPEDRNAIAVVGRGIQTLKKDLATRVARKGGQ